MMTCPEPVEILDFRAAKCPLNFVKTRLALEKIAVGQVIAVWIQADSESVLNIPSSLAAEGHAVLKQAPLPCDPASVCLWVQRLK